MTIISKVLVFLVLALNATGNLYAKDESFSVGWSSIDIPNISGFKYSDVGLYEKLFPDSKSLEYISKRRSDHKKRQSDNNTYI